MPVQYTITNDQGTVGKVGTGDIVNQLNQGGHQVQGVSPDGTELHMADDHGPFVAKTEDVLGKLGWQVSKAEPQNADYENVDPKLRAMVVSMPEHLRKPLIEAELRQRGIEDPKVVGSGRDWYAFHPGTNQYVALTNNPKHWGMGDLAEGAVEGGRGIASAIGGATGFALGGGTPAGVALAAGGAGLGGASADALTKAGLSAYSPAYRHLVEEHAGDVGWDMAGKAAIDAAAGGIATGMPLAARGLAEEMGPGLGRSLARGAATLGEQGPLSRTAQATGRAMDTTGGIVGDLAGIARRPGVGDLANMGDFTGITGWNGMPISGDLENLGYLAQAPEWMAQTGTKGLAAGGEKLAARGGTLGRIGEGMKGMAGKLTADRPSLGIQAAEENWMMPAASGNLDARTLFGNAFEGAASKAHKGLGLGRTAERRALVDAYKAARAQGATPGGAIHLGRQTAKAAGVANRAAAAAPFGRAGEYVGSGVKQAAELGRGMVATGRGLYNAGMGAVQGAGRGVQATGSVLEGLGDAAAPLENQLYMHYGAEENLTDPWNRSNPWRRGQGGGTIDPTTLARN